MVVVVVVGRSWLWLAAGLVEGASGSLTPSDPGLVWPLCYPSLTHTRLSPQRESVSQPASQAQPVSQSVSHLLGQAVAVGRPGSRLCLCVCVCVCLGGQSVAPALSYHSVHTWTTLT